MGLLQKTSKIEEQKSVKIKPIKDDEIPIPVYQFVVEIEDETVGLFQKISGMSVSREVEPLTVGGENHFGREFPGHISYGHITLEAGFTSSDFFWKWMVQGQEHGYTPSKTVSLIQRRPQPDPDGAKTGEEIFQVIKTWSFFNAFPVSWRIVDLDLGNSENIVMESLELSFDYFEIS